MQYAHILSYYKNTNKTTHENINFFKKIIMQIALPQKM